MFAWSGPSTGLTGANKSPGSIVSLRWSLEARSNEPAPASRLRFELLEANLKFVVAVVVLLFVA